MKSITIIAGVLFILILHLPLVAVTIDSTADGSYEAPVGPCDNWSQIKTCLTDNPHPCCEFTKSIYIDGYIIVYISPDDYRYIECPEEFEVDAKESSFLSPGNLQKSCENTSWGAIKTLY